MKTKILIVEDDKNISELIRLYLEKENFEVAQAENGKTGVELFHSFAPDLILLDLMLPVLDGWGVCREIRKTSKVPIIMVTAKDETFDKVMGLEIGADDYIAKPFDMKEVIARIHAVLRRCEKEAPDTVQQLEYENLVIDMDAYQVLVKGARVEMPPKEIELLNFLASHPNRVFTRNQLLDEVWDFDYFGDSRTVDVHVKRLRDKLPECEKHGWGITTIWRRGYKFEVK